MSTKAAAETTTTAWSTAVSWLPTACWVSVPRPLRPNTASVTTAPASSSPNSTPAMVSVGSRRSEEHTSELQSLAYLVCRLLLEKKKNITINLNDQETILVRSG